MDGRCDRVEEPIDGWSHRLAGVADERAHRNGRKNLGKKEDITDGARMIVALYGWRDGGIQMGCRQGRGRGQRGARLIHMMMKSPDADICGQVNGQSSAGKPGMPPEDHEVFLKTKSLNEVPWI